MVKRRGKFIVIDGTDGSGKATQTQILADRLKNAGFSVEIADFPQYGKKSAGLVEEYLNGKYGKAEEVGPYRASIFYACDRYDASHKIKEWLDDGKIVISNRYVTANMGHQGGKISNPLERKAYFSWLYDLEYKIFKIPKPDLNIILHVDAAIAQKLVDSKESRDYVGGKKRDIHEDDLNHLKQAEKVYLEISRSFPDFVLIECTRDNQILSREEISDMILQKTIQAINIDNSLTRLSPNFKHLHDQSSISPIEIPWPEKEKISPKIKIEIISPGAKLPTRAYAGDAGLDLYSADYYSIMPQEHTTVRTGIKIAIPHGFVGLIWDKGGVAKSGIHTMAGVIDSGFRGEVTVHLVNLSQDIYHIAPGQKIAQLLIQKVELPEINHGKINDITERGAGRFGSSGIF